MQLIIFKLENEYFGCDLRTLREIHRPVPITPVPKAPSHIRGVSNLRGIIMPVIDLRKRLGFPQARQDKDSRVMVVEAGEEHIGFEIDGVREVIKTDPSAIMPFDGTLDFKGKEAVWGMLRQPGGIITLLNLKSLL